jgi:hypothetical protein
MSHVVMKKGKYAELYESYRDERGRPRKRFLKYLGKFGDIDWKATLQGDPDDRAMAAAERAAERAGALESRPERQPTALPQGLRSGPVDPVPIEKAPASANYQASQSAPAEQDQETAPAEPASPAPDDAAPSETGHDPGAGQESDASSP